MGGRTGNSISSDPVMKTFSRLLLPFALLPAAVAQSNCPVPNLLANGDFESIGNFLNPWSSAARLLFPVGTVANSGEAPNGACEVAGDFSMTQPTPVQLTAGMVYTYGCDVQWMTQTPLRRGELVVAILDASGTEVARTFEADADNSGRRSRVSGVFVPDVSGDYTLAIIRSGATSHVTRVDNAILQQVSTSLCFEQRRLADAATTLRVESTPNTNFAVFFSIGGILPAQVPLPLPCSGGFGLGGAPQTLLSGRTNSSGVFRVTFDFPAGAAGVPIGWQTVELPPNCAFGCARILTFD